MVPTGKRVASTKKTKSHRDSEKSINDLKKKLKELQSKSEKERERLQNKVAEEDHSNFVQSVTHENALKDLDGKISKQKIITRRVQHELEYLKSSIQPENVEKATDHLRTICENYKKQTLEVQTLLATGQEQNMREAKPWRHCQTCTEEFSERKQRRPHILCCGHTFCHTCILTFGKGGDVEGFPRCPADGKLCRQITTHSVQKNFLALHM